MTDRPILFSAPMIRALLDGRKTQTRRVSKQQPAPPDNVIMPLTWWTKFAVGDRLWVREAIAIVGSVDPGWTLYRADGYEAECARHGFDKPYPPEKSVRWRPSIHMPRRASRLWLDVTDVRVERLQDISEADAQAEGISRTTVGEVRPLFAEPAPEWSDEKPLFWERGDDSDDALQVTAAMAYARLWDRINGPGSWDANPWVVALTFTVHRGNIDGGAT